ncbi:MAG TPA: ATP-binding protein [Microlunatus sp.]
MSETEVRSAPPVVEADDGPDVAIRSAQARSVSGVGRRLVRALAYVVAVAAVAAVVVGSILFTTDNPDIWVMYGTMLVRELVPGTVTFAAVGVWVLGHRRAAAVGWVMLAAALSWGLSALCSGLWFHSFEAGWDSTAQFWIASFSFLQAGWVLGMVVLLQVFPTGWLSGWVWRVLLFVSVLAFLVHQTMSVLIEWESSFPEHPAPIDLETFDLLLEVRWWIELLVVFAVLAERIRRGPYLVRRQVAPLAVVWVLCMAIEWFRSTELSESRSSLAFIAGWLWPVVVALVIAVTVTQVGLWDSRVVVRRFGVYVVVVGALSLIFAGVYFAMLLALSSPAVGTRFRWLALLVAAAAVFAADPLRRRIRASLERRLLGERSEPLRPLARLDALTSAGSADDDQVYRTITEIVAEAVRAPGVTLALHQASQIEVVAGAGDEPNDPVVLPLLHRGERLGELRVAPRTPGEPYGRHDRALLDQLASQAAALVYGQRRDTDIATLRREAIEALIEQRMSLGRDLHDGLAPLLAGAGLTADALRRGMPQDSPDAADAARLATRLRTAASEVRRIAHDLQPTPDTPHLTAVIMDYVASVGGPGTPHLTVELAAGSDADLSATTELGLSRVALEAITNVVRHAHATSGEVTLRRLDHEIELVVADDGVGISQPYVSGIGITSMRSRVQALGGSFELTPRPGGGTILLARVPVP